MTDVPLVVRLVVNKRAGRGCERCLLVRATLYLHHRQQRSCGGQDTPSNLVAVCARCHDRIHEQRPEDGMYATGWLLRGWQEPDRVPVRMPRGWMRLLDSGDVLRLASKSPGVARPEGRT